MGYRRTAVGWNRGLPHVCPGGVRKWKGEAGGGAAGTASRRRAGGAEKRLKMEYKFTAENFEAEVLKSDIPVLVDFYADWCGPCKMMAPIVAQLAEEYDGRVKVGKCNIDEEDGLARMYRVMSIPTFKIFVKGKDVATIVGAVQKEQLVEEIRKVL